MGSGGRILARRSAWQMMRLDWHADFCMMNVKSAREVRDQKTILLMAPLYTTPTLVQGRSVGGSGNLHKLNEPGFG
jgi:hypothetical protein